MENATQINPPTPQQAKKYLRGTGRRRVQEQLAGG